MRIVWGVFVALQFSMPLVTLAQESSAGVAIPNNDAIDFPGFVKVSRDLQHARESRRVPIATFNEMAHDPQTIILDTRSKWAFDLVHVAGAVHLNFSDFTAEKLRKVIPSKQTRILIYCNNNFKNTIPKERDPNSGGDATDEADEKNDIIEGTTNKLPSFALNIPTFINLHGYGYENVYELADQLELDDPRLRLEGTGVRRRQQ